METLSIQSYVTWRFALRSDLHYRVQLTLHIKCRVGLQSVSLKLINIKYFINTTCERLSMCHAKTAENKFWQFHSQTAKNQITDYAHGTPRYLQEIMSHCQVLYRRSHTDNTEIKPRPRQWYWFVWYRYFGMVSLMILFCNNCQQWQTETIDFIIITP